MSKNNQYLVVEHDDKFHVFDVMAEAWGEKGKSELSIKQSLCNYPTRDEAHKAAHHFEAHRDWSEYGVVDDVLAKDGTKVKIV